MLLCLIVLWVAVILCMLLGIIHGALDGHRGTRHGVDSVQDPALLVHDEAIALHDLLDGLGVYELLVVIASEEFIIPLYLLGLFDGSAVFAFVVRHSGVTFGVHLPQLLLSNSVLGLNDLEDLGHHLLSLFLGALCVLFRVQSNVLLMWWVVL